MTDTKMQLVDWLDDLCVRFIINLPQEELESVERICFQVEEAQWFYEDFIRPLDATLPSLNLRSFCLLMFQHCPLLAPFPEEQYLAAFNEFLAYKVRVPVRGAIMLDEDMEQVVLVKGWKKSGNWSFPRGKINKDEDDLVCAIREVYEETGFDLAAAGLVPLDKSQQKYIEVTMREQHMKLFVFKGVPRDTIFVPRTRKEISKVSWFRLADLPGYRKMKKQQNNAEVILTANKLYMVAPFMQPLKKWIGQQRRAEASHGHAVNHDLSAGEEQLVEYLTGNENIPHLQPDMDMPDTQPAWNILSRKEAPLAPSGLTLEYANRSSMSSTAELKRLLSVGEPASPPINTPTNRNMNSLLSMLRQGSKPIDGDGDHLSTRMPRNSLDPVSINPAETYNPHLLHSTQPPIFQNLSTPPAFPVHVQSRGDFYYGTQNHYPALGSHQQHHPAGLGFNHNNLLHPTINQHMHNFSSHAPRQATAPLHSYDHVTGQQFGRQVVSVLQSPIAPDASQLPQPRLSNHAQNLLNAFRSPEKRSATVSSTPHAFSKPQHPQAPSTPLSGGNTSATQQNRNLLALFTQQPDISRSRTVLGQTPNITDPTVGTFKAGAVPEVNDRIAKSSAQQEALLKLFQKQPASTPAPLGTRQSLDVSNSGPVELSAMQSLRLPELSVKKEPVTPFAHTNLSLPPPKTASNGMAELAFMRSPPLSTSDLDTSSSRAQPQALAGGQKQESTVPSKPHAEPSAVKILKRERVTAPATSPKPTTPPNVSDIDLRVSGASRDQSQGRTDVRKPASPQQFGTGTVRRNAPASRASQPVSRNESPIPGQITPIQILKRPSTANLNPETLPTRVVETTRRAPSPLAELPTTSPKPRTTQKPSMEPRPSTPKAEPAKPFQPQILRRPVASAPTVADPPAELTVPKSVPQPVPSALPSVLSPTPPAQSAAGTSQKEALLSLFGKSPDLTRKPSVAAASSSLPTLPPSAALGHTPVANASSTPTMKSSTVSSPAPDHKASLLSLFNKPGSGFNSTIRNTPLSAPSVPAVSNSTPTATPLASGIISPLQMPPLVSKLPPLPVANMPPLLPQAISSESAPRTRLNSLALSSAMPSVAGSSGRDNPISPSDRGFLLNLLKGL